MPIKHLERCGNCGGEAKLTPAAMIFNPFIRCQGCLLTIPGTDEESLVANWNRRTHAVSKEKRREWIEAIEKSARNHEKNGWYDICPILREVSDYLFHNVLTKEEK